MHILPTQHCSLGVELAGSHAAVVLLEALPELLQPVFRGRAALSGPDRGDHQVSATIDIVLALLTGRLSPCDAHQLPSTVEVVDGCPRPRAPVNAVAARALRRLI
jgi:hypothetical protein